MGDPKHASVESKEIRDPADRPDDEESGLEEPVEEVAASTLRVVLLILGTLLVLYASGQAIGLDILGIFSEALDTQEARWIIVAFFGLVLIAVSFRGFRAKA